MASGEHTPEVFARHSHEPCMGHGSRGGAPGHIEKDEHLAHKSSRTEDSHENLLVVVHAMNRDLSFNVHIKVLSGSAVLHNHVAFLVFDNFCSIQAAQLILRKVGKKRQCSNDLQ